MTSLAANMAFFRYYQLDLIKSYEIGPVLISYQMVSIQIASAIFSLLPTRLFKFVLQKCPTEKFANLATKEKRFYKKYAKLVRLLIYTLCAAAILFCLSFTIFESFSAKPHEFSQWLGAFFFAVLGMKSKTNSYPLLKIVDFRKYNNYSDIGSTWICPLLQIN